MKKKTLCKILGGKQGVLWEMLNEGLEIFTEWLPCCNKLYFLLSSKSKIRLKDTLIAMISTYTFFTV